MAIKQAIESSVGVDATYHRISQIRINWESQTTNVVVASMYTQATSRAGKGALGSIDVQTPVCPFNPHLARAGFGVAEGQDLLATAITFDRGMAYCTLSLAKSVAGHRINWDEQFPGLPLAELPENYLAYMYTKVQAEVFPEGEEV